MLLRFEKFLNQLFHPLFQLRLRLIIFGTEVHHFVFGLIYILYHGDHLADNKQRLPDILFNELDHGCSKVILDYIDVSERQTQALHVIQTLDVEFAP